MKRFAQFLFVLPTIFCKHTKNKAHQLGLTLKSTVILNGDNVVFGNTLGFDCTRGLPKPIVGDATTACYGFNDLDTGIDAYWYVTSTTANASRSISNWHFF